MPEKRHLQPVNDETWFLPLHLATNLSTGQVFTTFDLAFTGSDLKPCRNAGGAQRVIMFPPGSCQLDEHDELAPGQVWFVDYVYAGQPQITYVAAVEEAEPAEFDEDVDLDEASMPSSDFEKGRQLLVLRKALDAVFTVASVGIGNGSWDHLRSPGTLVAVYSAALDLEKVDEEEFKLVLADVLLAIENGKSVSCFGDSAAEEAEIAEQTVRFMRSTRNFGRLVTTQATTWWKALEPKGDQP